MSRSSEPTEPRMGRVGYQNEVSAPPRFLLWGVILLFLLVIGGILGGVWAFNNILSDGQQERVINELPFMEAFQFRAPTPEGGILPTPDTGVNADPLNLLNMPIGSTATPPTEATAVETEENTPLPPTPTATATERIELTPTIQQSPTQDSAALPNTPEIQLVSSQFSRLNLPQSHRNYGFVWERQTWNNCGPATLTTALSFFGWGEDQEYAKDYLRPNREDKNVTPEELTQFVNQRTGVRAIWRMGGTIDVLRGLIAGGFPVIIERGIMFEANDWLGHYQALVAYDDIQRNFYAYDSFLGEGSAGEGISQGYIELDDDWRAFNRTFIVIFQQENEAQLQSILGNLWDPEQAAEAALETALEELRINQADGFAWHNAGTSLVALGRYQESANAFDRARLVGIPWRMLWYQFGALEAYYHLGRLDDVLALTQANLNQAPELEESYYWRGLAYAARGDMANALTDLRAALRYNPNFTAARSAIDELNG